MDFYNILEVSKEATQDEIRKSFKRLAMKYHPDRNKEPDAEAKFKAISKAFEVLGFPEKREIYDLTGTYEDIDEQARQLYNSLLHSIIHSITTTETTDIKSLALKSLERDRDNLASSCKQCKTFIDQTTKILNRIVNKTSTIYTMVQQDLKRAEDDLLDMNNQINIKKRAGELLISEFEYDCTVIKKEGDTDVNNINTRNQTIHTLPNWA